MHFHDIFMIFLTLTLILLLFFVIFKNDNSGFSECACEECVCEERRILAAFLPGTRTICLNLNDVNDPKIAESMLLHEYAHYLASLDTNTENDTENYAIEYEKTHYIGVR